MKIVGPVGTSGISCQNSHFNMEGSDTKKTIYFLVRGSEFSKLNNLLLKNEIIQHFELNSSSSSRCIITVKKK